MLDHSAFPHILDRVLVHAGPDLLLAFRHTSRAVCARVDRLLRHITVTMDETEPAGDRALTLSAGPWHATFPRPDMSHLTNEQALALVAADRTRLTPLLRRAHTIDMHGPLSYSLPPLPVEERDGTGDPPHALCTAPRVLRLHPDGEGRLASSERSAAHTLVVFAGSAAKDTADFQEVTVGEGTVRVVVNLPVVEHEGVARWFSWHGHPDLWTAVSDGKRGAGLLEVVYVFHTVERKDSEDGGEDDDSEDDLFRAPSNDSDFDINDDGPWLALSDSVIFLLRNPRTQLLFVGFPPRMRKGNGVVGPRNVHNVAAEAITVGAPHHVRPEPLALSHAEYAERVGAAVYALETTPDAPEERGAGPCASLPWRWPHSAAPGILDPPRLT